MTVTVASVPYRESGISSNEAEVLVKERFDLAQTYAEQSIAAANGYLASLSQLFASSQMPSSSISYDFQSISLESDLDRPSAPSMEMGDVSTPKRPDIDVITVPTIYIPSYTLESPTVEIGYQEPVYQSDLQNALKLILKDFVENGGTGLGADVEDALWTRARARQDILNERTYNEAEEYFASRGYTTPPGALGGRLTEALAEQTRADAQLNYEISIEQARLARAQTEHSILAAISLEGQDKEQFNNTANRALELAKSAAQVILDLFNTKVQAYVSRIEAAKLEIEAEKLKVDAQVAANENTINIYAADIEAFKVKLQKEISIVENIAKVYGFTIAGYEADIKLAAADLDAQIKAYQGNIDQANNQTALTLKEAEMTIQSYLGALQLTSDSMKASGNISAQIAASALSAVNASASLGDSYSRSYDVNSSYSARLSNSANLSESHTYDETKD